MNIDALNKVQFDSNLKASINYAKARASIEQCCKNRAEKRKAKQIVINYLKGKIKQGRLLRGGEHMHNLVEFEDGSCAKY